MKCYNKKEFFMVLDFKVNVKIGCRDDNQFFMPPALINSVVKKHEYNEPNSR